MVLVEEELDEGNGEVMGEEVGVKMVGMKGLRYEWKKEMIEIGK